MGDGNWMDAEEAIRSDANAYVAWALKDHNIRKPRSWKIIQDVLGGPSRFEPWEIAIIDTPLVQRLRRIGQTGLSSLLYPSAHATRFEHSLGVAVETAKIMGALNAWAQSEGVDAPFPPEVRDFVRAAALLHDVGHGPFSHSSEYLWLSQSREVYELTRNDDSPYRDRRPHEVLSAFIVESPRMAEFFKELEEKCGVAISPGNVAKMVLNLPGNAADAYVYQVVNGPFDADKLDYIRRDSYVTGLQMALEVDRLIHSLQRANIGDQNAPHNVIAVSTGGVHALQQILFSKMLLTSALYHHHKVRAIESMISAAFRAETGKNDNIFGKQPLTSPVHYLYLDDVRVLAAPRGAGLADGLVRDVLDRRLVKRALTVSRETLENAEDDIHYDDLANRMMNSSDERDGLSQSICAELAARGVNLNKEQRARVLVDFPVPPSFSEAVQTFVLRENGQLTRLEDFFSLDSWVAAYREFFYCGRVFGPETHQCEVGVAARRVLARDYNVSLSPMACDTCKYGKNWEEIHDSWYPVGG